MPDLALVGNLLEELQREGALLGVGFEGAEIDELLAALGDIDIELEQGETPQAKQGSSHATLGALSRAWSIQSLR